MDIPNWEFWGSGPPPDDGSQSPQSCLRVVQGKNGQPLLLDDESGTGGQKQAVVTLQCIPYLFKNFINTGLMFAGLVALIIIIIAGFQMARSGGDPKQLDTARKTITYAIIGLLVVFFSFLIVQLISLFTGVDCIAILGLGHCN